MFSNLKLVATKLRGATAQLPYLAQALSLVRKAAGGWTLLWLGLLVIKGLLPVATVTLTKALVDSLVIAIESGGDWETLRLSLFYALLMGLIMLLQELLRGVSSWVRTSQNELVRDYISALVHRQSIALDLAFYDSPEYYDHLHRARYEASNRPIALLDSMGNLLQNSITMIAMSVVLIAYARWLPLALFFSTLPALYVVLHHTIREHEWNQRTTADRRRAWYYDYLLTAREVASELRLFGTGEHFITRFQLLRTRLRDERLALLKNQALARLSAGIAALLVLGLTMAWMVWQALQGLFTLGDLALFYSAFSQGQNLMRSLLQNLGQIYRNMLFLGNLFEYLALEPQVVDKPHPFSVPLPQEGIRFSNVTFSYPDSERTALQDFDLDIPAGKMVAIVGVNGAGKTTLLKLLCRFYDPQSGHIELDGTDLRDYALEELRRSITVLFQEPVPYQDTAGKNIAFGDLLSEADSEAIWAAAEAAGADSVIAKLPHGYETQLGKWFKGGTDLSVGEWQRIALARAFLRQASIIILDEPTSAMDPWAERDWLQRFRDLAYERTTVLITHRFTTAKHADMIHVMHNGRIVESGNHEALLALDGRYARSWQAQMLGKEESDPLL
ncbi:MAG: ABC transporter ATP-binding protein [Anaerolineaceae bacterium]|nr:MAG: ABC transporter ATP-binding protein [Anaerolineaceae bacterium]